MYRQLYQVGGMSGMGIESLSPMQPAMQPAMQSAMYTPLENTYYSGMPMMANGGRIGYQGGGSIEEARNFFINQQGLSPDQADMIVGQGLQAYNQQAQPQSMMQMASGGIARLGYQMGGEAMMQPQMGGEMNMPQEQSGMQLGEGDNALLTIIQLLIEQGIDPETAQRLARQILAIFAQGGEPALDQFIGQLEQQEQTEAMAEGGIAGYGYRQGYGFGGIGKIFKGAAKAVSGVVKGVAKAVKSVAKSPIGKIALTIGATMLLGPGGMAFGSAGLAGSMGVTNAFLAGAINAGAANLLVQGVTTGKINPKEALMASVLGGATGYLSSGTPGGISPDVGGLTDAQLQAAGQRNLITDVGLNVSPSPQTNIPFDTGSYAGSVQNITDVGMITPSPQDVLSNVKASNLASSQGQTLQQLGELTPKPTGFFESIPGKVQSGIQQLYKDPMGTIGNLAKSGYESVKENIIPLTVGTGIGSIAFGAPQQDDESNEDFAKRQQDEANASITQFGRNLQIRNPFFYSRYGAEDPFAVQTAAQGGIMGYAAGGSMIPPARRIEGGVIELDARKTGGYIPYGKKERVDDVPAMLAKDEFVFTSRAVKGAGGGSARRGAAKMYKLMKQLEAKGKKMERQGARA
jgi:hypothetical protein